MSDSASVVRSFKNLFISVEAAGMLTLSKILLRTIALQRWSALLGHPTNTDGLDVNGAPAQGSEGVVALGIARAARYLPVGFTCLERASAGQFMLRLRGNAGAVVIGLKSNGIKPNGNGEGHAWLVGKTGVLTGRVDHGQDVLTPVSAFR